MLWTCSETYGLKLKSKTLSLFTGTGNVLNFLQFYVYTESFLSFANLDLVFEKKLKIPKQRQIKNYQFFELVEMYNAKILMFGILFF